jgi:xylan 1,4-beta-xylosidase
MKDFETSPPWRGELKKRNTLKRRGGLIMKSASVLLSSSLASHSYTVVILLSNRTKRFSFFIFYFLLFSFNSFAQQRTYCNPINIDYGYTPIPNFSEWGKHRATADPVIVNYKGDFYLFSTNQWGYWWSSDMLNWKFVSKKFLRPWNTGTYDELCAPAVGIIGDTMIVFGSTYTNKFTIWMSTNPKANEWKPLVDSFEIGGWDPAFFTDDDGKLYMYNGSSNTYPLYGIELDRKTFLPIGTRKEMHMLKQWRYGWQRFGEHMDNTFLDPFMEGAWMTKHNGKYYLQYGAPGTEFSGYADGVAVADNPLGSPTRWFQDQSDPLSIKVGGYVRGAGHGSTFLDKNANYWHVSTTVVSVKNTFERRIGIWPAGFDKDDVMWCNTSFGDYPHYISMYIPKNYGGRNVAQYDNEFFTGWMLLNYNKPVQVSSTLGGYVPNNAVDELTKTYWSATSGNKGEWIQTDLGNVSTVNAVQINYADQDAEFLGKQTNIYHQYKMYSSVDGKKWTILVDKSNNRTDVPHEYVELQKPVQARFIKVENIHVPTGKFAISGLRVFGNGNGAKPNNVEGFIVLRTEKDKRSAFIKWKPVDNAFAYNIYYGTHPDKLYSCIMVHSNNEYWMKAMDSQKTYYYSIEAINENGVSEKSKTIKVE